MSDRVRLMSIVGARPQFVKLAPIARAMETSDGVVHSVIHTGQHYDRNMSARFFDELELPKPDRDLGVGSGSHAHQTAAMLTGLEAAFEEEKPDAVLVYGDTNSTLAATLAAAKMHVPVVHIEAGLRSFNREMPEEINRLVADHCGDRLYAPTPQAMKNLEQEGLGERGVITGDVMLDAVMHNIELAEQKCRVMQELGLEAGGFGLVTVHRPVNTTGPALASLMQALTNVAEDQLPLLFPVHPRTRAALESIEFAAPAVLRLIDPLPYLDNITLVRAAALVITDSGGVQKEAAFLHTPCLTMRSETEWTETIETGVNRLVGEAGVGLVDTVQAVLGVDNMFNEETLARLTEHYGDGQAAEAIVTDCIEWISTMDLIQTGMHKEWVRKSNIG